VERAGDLGMSDPTIEARHRIGEDLTAVLSRAHMNTDHLVLDLLNTLEVSIELKSDPIETGENHLYVTNIPGPLLYRLTATPWKKV
jgi:hypothetical protein